MKELETVYVDFGDISAQATIERLVELCGIEAVKSAVDEIAAQHRAHPTNGGLCAICNRPEYAHSPKGHDFRPAISG